MHEIMELKDKLIAELEEYGKKEMSAGTLDVVDKLAHAIKNLDKVIEHDDGGEYSGDYRYGRMMPYMGGVAYARGRGSAAKRDAMGRYSSERGGSYERGYSRDMANLADQLRDLMHDAPDEAIRKDMERLLNKVERM